MSLAWLVPLLIVQRLAELGLAQRNRRRLLARGGREYHAQSYRAIVLLHSLFLGGLLVEGYPWQAPAGAATGLGLLLLLALQGLRYWCIASLGDHWNTRIVILPGAQAIRRGPYRWLRHPNYLVVVLEFLLLPLLLHAPLTLLLCFPANLLLLRQRIRLEEAALCAATDYARTFAAP